MISVILYGRNDAHGYNLHRRAALSLNCLAEVLTDPDDEIVFVDYNTPDELPTFLEALSDTLTDRCRGLLRVLRVPAAIHRQRFASHTHLSIVEPVSRNAAARRSNASNRWLLSTNTDMIFLPLVERSLTEICTELSDGFYGLPRFELPEWLWEQLPRNDPHRALEALTRLGPGMRLDEPTVSHEWVRFDAPGDFQLVLREDFFAIDGFDEEMLLGWHVDSNLSRRMLLYRGSIENLGDNLAGYHCNHSRTPTTYHGVEQMIANDLDRFFVSVDRADLPAQRGSWGLPDTSLEEVSLREGVGPHVADSVIAVIPNARPSSSSALEAQFALTYDSGHVLPFIVDSLVVSPPSATVAYLGVNPILERMLAELVAGRAGGKPLAIPRLEDPESVVELARTADVFVVDFGLDASLLDLAPDAGRDADPVDLTARLPLVLAALDRLCELERDRLERGEHPRRVVLVNSSTVAVDPYVTAHLACSYTTVHSRVRRAIVRAVPADEYAASSVVERQSRLVRWNTKSAEGLGGLDIRPGETVRIAEMEDYRGFRDGWAYPEYFGAWTVGTRSELAIGLDGIGRGQYRLALSIRGICVGRDDALEVEAHLNGTRVATRRFSRRHLRMWWIDLPSQVLAERGADLALVIDDPRSPLAVGWSADERPLGILLHSITLQKVHRIQWLTDRLVRAYLYLRATIGFRRYFKRLRRLMRPSILVPRRSQ